MTRLLPLEKFTCFTFVIVFVSLIFFRLILFIYLRLAKFVDPHSYIFIYFRYPLLAMSAPFIVIK